MESGDDGIRREHRAAFHEEVNGLLRGDRAAFVLCDLEGQAMQGVARQVRWPVVELERRLARARRRLQARMSRRGCTIPIARLAAEVCRETDREVPWSLIEATVAVAIRECRRRAGSALGRCLGSGLIAAAVGPFFGEGPTLMGGSRVRRGEEPPRDANGTLDRVLPG